MFSRKNLPSTLPLIRKHAFPFKYIIFNFLKMPYFHFLKKKTDLLFSSMKMTSSIFQSSSDVCFRILIHISGISIASVVGTLKILQVQKLSLNHKFSSCMLQKEFLAGQNHKNPFPRYFFNVYKK